MHPCQVFRKGLGGIALLLGTALVAGCGSSAAATPAARLSSTATAQLCPAQSFQAVTGTVQNISSSTLTVADQRGGTVQARYTSTTRFARQVAATVGTLQEGMPVAVATTQNANNTYSATTILVFERGAFGNRGGFGGAPGGFPGARSGAGRSTLSGAGSRSRAARNCFERALGVNVDVGRRGITGTVAQVNGNLLTVTDFSGTDFIVTITSATQILMTQTATASALQAGVPVTVIGTRDNQGVLTARSITILLRLPVAGTTRQQWGG
jgi:hypothetical protein